jgi:hypothetical protein
MKYRLFLLCALMGNAGLSQSAFFISPHGNDRSPGTLDRPFATLQRAKDAMKKLRVEKGGVAVFLREGTYCMSSPLEFGSEDSGTKESPITFKAYNHEKVVISGGVPLQLSWRAYENGIWRAKVDQERYGDVAFDQLFIDGQLQRMARYPNYDDSAQFFKGTAKDAISPERVKTWKNPKGGFMHALHRGKWGSKHYRIESVDDNGELSFIGGWQENRGGTDKDLAYRSGYHPRHLFVENIFEELDDVGEWFFDKATHYLYYKPQDGMTLSSSQVITANLTQLFIVRGTCDRPVRHINFEGLELRHTKRVFMEPYERLLRGDWSISRTSAIVFEGTESCSVKDCNFEDLGGNGVFFSRYTRQGEVTGSRFYNLGESAVCLVGSLAAVRTPSVEYRNSVPYDQLDTFPGPHSPDYPKDCLIENNLVHQIGLVGKQVAGVFMSMAEEIDVRHNTIYNIPRAAICINDGTWGGHVIENNDAFNTVRESGDHGPFNSWGRDRYWLTRHHGRDKGDESGAKQRSLLDNHKVTYIRHNRFSHPGGHSWGIDLDDGSSNYHLYNNLCLGMGFKLREGFHRRVENNIVIDGFGGFHVWFKDCDDVIARNIIVDETPYRFIAADPEYARQIDYNLFYSENGMPEVSGVGDIMSFEQWQQKGFDVHSLVADPMFVDAKHGDFRVKPGSPALKLGFENFRMDNFGVYKPAFVAEVSKADRTRKGSSAMGGEPEEQRSMEEHAWMGATIRNLVGNAEKSVAGIAEITGVTIREHSANSYAKTVGFKVGDVIIALNGCRVHDTNDLFDAYEKSMGKTVDVVVTGNPIRRSFGFVVK